MLSLASLSATSFAAPAPLHVVSRAAPVRMSFKDGLIGADAETAYKKWDPLGISDVVDDSTLKWFRAAEIKHGRVAMLASVGYLVGALGITFPGEIAKGVTFESVNAAGVFSAWGNVPAYGKLQILTIILMLEWASETKKPHYTSPDGVPGKIDQLPFEGIKGIWTPKIRFWDPLGFMGALTEEQKAEKRLSELKNGRLAMLGITSFLVGKVLPNSVPFIKGDDAAAVWKASAAFVGQ